MECVETLYDKGHALFRAGEFARSFDVFSAALAADPANEFRFHGEILHFQARALQAMNRHNDAISFLEKVLTLAPKCPEFLIDLGDSLRSIGENSKAASVYQCVLDLALPGEELTERAFAGLQLSQNQK